MNKCDLWDNGLFPKVISQFDNIHRRCVECPKMNRPSGWLTVFPVGQNHFDLSSRNFVMLWYYVIESPF